MTVVLDAYALIALALDEPAAGEVEALVRRGSTAVSAVNLAEAVDVLGRVHDVPAERIRASFELLLGEPVAVLAVDENAAWRAAQLRARHYHRTRSPVSLADCVLLAAARRGDAVATPDAAVAAAARSEGVELIALPDSGGRRP